MHAPDLDQTSFDLWCDSFRHLSATTRRARQLIVRKFCLYRQRAEPDCFVPNPLYFVRLCPYRRPVIIEPKQVAQMLVAADDLALTTNSPLLPVVMRLAVVLLYTAGLRRGELVRLSLNDVEPQTGLLRIRASKFNKSRLVPLSPDAGSEFRAYLRHRLAPLFDTDPNAPLLCNGARAHRRYTGAGLGQAVNRLFVAANVVDKEGRRPRVHDIRHSFALEALIRWYSRWSRHPVQPAPPVDVHGPRLDCVNRPLPALRADDARTCKRSLRSRVRRCCRGGVEMRAYQPTGLGRSIVRFFQEYLPTLRGTSRHTIQSYRDAMILFLGFVAKDRGRPVEALELADITADRVGRFLAFLEIERKNSVTTRNARLAAMHTFARFLVAENPDHMAALQQILGIPFKRGARAAPIEYLEKAEIEVLLAGIDRKTSAGRRDYAMFSLMFNTGARVQEILNLRAMLGSNHPTKSASPAKATKFASVQQFSFCPRR
jgi:site-specific recombinase XerD